jgi:ABC-2 type transport system permease protein
MQSFNYYGTYMLTLREIRRFLKVYHQTIIAPAISAMIFLSIFVLASHSPDAMVGDIKFINFMGYGLIIMTIVQNSFANSSSSLIMSKVIGYVNDILMPPFAGFELVIAYSIGSLSRGLAAGLVLLIFLSPFIDLHAAHPGLLVFFTIGSCLLMGMLGTLAGIASNSFEQYSAITAYIVTPLSFLSGTFYSVTKLPIAFQIINYFNPFFYMIDGFRYSITNHSDGNVTIGIWVVLLCNIALFSLIVRLFNRGWKLRG